VRDVTRHHKKDSKECKERMDNERHKKEQERMNKYKNRGRQKIAGNK
jgi:hypothetical protein